MEKKNDSGEIEKIVFIDEDRDKIKLRLRDIQDSNVLNSIDLNFRDRRIPLKSISIKDAEDKCGIYENVSKLGVYIMSDYELLSNLSVRSFSRSPLYEMAMKNLGYQRHRHLWYLKSRPNQDVIIDLVFKYNYYSYIVQEKKADQAKHNHDYRPFGALANESGRCEKSKTDQNKIEDSEDNEKNERKNFATHGSRRGRTAKSQERTPKDKVNENRYEKKDFNKQTNDNVYDDETDINQWKCKDCSAMNLANSLHCILCRNKKVRFAGWDCPKCTFKNESKSPICEICEYIQKML